MLDRALEIINDDEARRAISRLAFHWYSGDHFEALGAVREKFPDKELIFTEGCVEYSRFGGSSQIASAEI